MTMMKITLTGRIPSKKNSKRIVMAGHRPMILSSKDYEAWHTIASFELKSQVKGMANRIRLTGPYRVHIIIFAENLRKADLTNKAESIMDLLVDNYIVEDDNWFAVPQIELTFGGVDKKNPRAEIELTRVRRLSTPSAKQEEV